MTNEELIVSPEEEGLRLDKFLSERFSKYSRQYFQYLIAEKLVLVNGELVKKAARVAEGDEIEIEFALTPEISLTPEPIPLDILYEDDDLIAVNKPVGMVVHPAVGNWSGTFVNALIYHCQHLERDETLRPGIVHRLDKETSGVLLAAKNMRTQQKLVEAFAHRKVEKEYLAITLGNPGNREIRGNIGRHPVHRKKMAVLEERGKEAITECEILAHDHMFSLVRLKPKTGRTHQLRVHLKHVGCPILGDALYGNPGVNQKFGIERQLLHASRLGFIHPASQDPIVIKAPIPQDMRALITRLTHDETFDPTR